VNALASLGLLAPATDVGLALGGDTDPVLNA
jgi:hypothetical protein